MIAILKQMAVFCARPDAPSFSPRELYLYIVGCECDNIYLRCALTVFRLKHSMIDNAKRIIEYMVNLNDRVGSMSRVI